MTTEINLRDKDHIVITETCVTEQVISKANLEIQKADILIKVADIDELLEYFVEK